jgi:hypothetical protein
VPGRNVHRRNGGDRGHRVHRRGDLAVERSLEHVYDLIVNARGDRIRLEAAGGNPAVVSRSAIAYVVGHRREDARRHGRAGLT